MKFQFASKNIDGVVASIREDRYVYNNSLRLTLINANADEILCVATTMILGYDPAPGCVFIKNWSENEGVYEALFAAGVVGPIIRKIPAGFTEAYECKYLG